MITIAYMTNRAEPMFEWFADSLHNECQGNYTDIRVVMVDFYRDQPFRFEEMKQKAFRMREFIHVSPKPTVWQGPHRLTKENCFAASNARNTALCYALDGYIAYVDDLAILLPGWLSRVRAAMEGGYIALGSFQKVSKMMVQGGVLLSCVDIEQGKDSRLRSATTLTPASGNWHYGCSVAGPVEAYLSVNGWDEDCDGMGAEDYACGIMLEKSGWKLMFDPQMRTYESEELHFIGEVFRRINEEEGEEDKAHRYLRMIGNGRLTAPNFFPPGGIRAMREAILKGGSFPVSQIPQHSWYSGKHISEL